MRLSPPFPRSGARNGAARKRRISPWLAMPVLLVAAAIAVIWRLQTSTTTATVTSTTNVTQGTLTTSVSGSGTVAAARTVDLAFQQTGTITAVDVAVGDTVTAGQALATLDTADLQLQLQQAQASLKAAEASLAAAKGEGAARQRDGTRAAAQTRAQAAQDFLSQRGGPGTGQGAARGGWWAR